MGAAASSDASSKAAQTAAYIETMPGIPGPFDSPFFDPLGLHKGASIPDVRRWREAEITHGRVAMLAALGFVVGEQLEDSDTWLLFDGNITGPAIGHYQQLGQGFWEPAARHRHLRELPRGRGVGHPQGQRLQPAQGGLHARG